MRTILLLAVTVLAGCSGDFTDIDGVYQASVHTMDPSGCGPGESVSGTSIFRLERVNFLGHIVYKYELCTAPRPTACLDLGLLSIRFTEPIANGWADDTYNATVSGSSCTLTRLVSTATRMPDGTLRVEFQRFRRESAVPSGGCTRQAAIEQAATLPCVSSELQIAARVQ